MTEELLPCPWCGVCLTVAPSLPVITLPIVAKMADDLKNNRTDNWPPQAYTCLKNIRATANALHATALVRVPVNGDTVEANFTEPSPTAPVENLRGLTTIYGRVMRLGGVEPKVDLAPLTGSGILHCEATEAVVKSLEGRLYEHVSLHGMAQWDPFSLKIKKFSVVDWQPFAHRNPVDALATLREQFGKYFDDIDDVDAWVNELRSENGE